MTNLDEIIKSAYESMNATRQVATEDITCDPDLRAEFMSIIRMELPDAYEGTALRRLSYLRKRSLLPRYGRKKVKV